MAIQYAPPEQWVRYVIAVIASPLIEAKAAVQALTALPIQRAWADALQAMELKREVAGTSRIEGAEFTERELDEALAEGVPGERLTRSQRQARAAQEAYRWIAGVDPDRPIDEDLIRTVHRRIVTGCDDDHCPPGELRGSDNNVVFGRPRHRGVEGGKPCTAAFARLVEALGRDFRPHDPLIQALALHYHLGAMHPFLDGNGRTARALEALMLRRAGLKDTLFVAMSNYYYDEKDGYLAALSQARESGHDLTPFLAFGLKGIATQCNRLLREVREHLQRSLFRDVMGRMYNRLHSTKKRALAKRQCEILSRLLDVRDGIELDDLLTITRGHYAGLKESERAFIRDVNHLLSLRAIDVQWEDRGPIARVRLDWPTEITETEFYKRINELPEAKTRRLYAPHR